MWIFGQVTKKEAKKLKSWGYEVTDINVDNFNKLLDPKNKGKKVATKDIMIAVWIDSDVFGYLSEVYDEEIYADNMKAKLELMDLRKSAATNTIDFFDFDKEGMILKDYDNFELVSEDRMECKIYWEDAEACGRDGTSTFVVVFKKNSDVVKENYINNW